MTALTADIQVQAKDLGLKSYAVADNVKIYKGGLVAIDTNGYARPATDTASYNVAGVADEQVDNTVTGHTAGGLNVRVRSGRTFLLVTSGAAQSNVGAMTYVTDDQTVAFSGTSNAILVGPVSEYVSATSVWVNIPPGGQGTATIATTSASLTTGAVIATSATSSAATFPLAGLAAATATSAGGTIAVTGGVGGTTSGAGGTAFVTGGAGGTAGTGDGGAVRLQGGASGTGATGNGGAAAVTGGAASSTNGTGGAITVTGGAGVGTGAGGAVTVTGGAGGATGGGGNFAVTAGRGGSTSGAAGTAAITAGAGGASSTVNGGTVVITGGASGSGATGAGGAVSLIGGAAASTNGAGGAANLTGGAGVGTGNGGIATVSGGAGGATSGNGGNVDLAPGALGGTGAAGEVTVSGSTSGFVFASSTYNAPGATNPMFVAARAYRVKSIQGRVLVAGTGGACTAAFWRAPSATALAGGTALNTGSYNLVGTVDANQTLTLAAAANLLVAAGDTVGFVVTGTSTSATGVLTVTLAPM